MRTVKLSVHSPLQIAAHGFGEERVPKARRYKASRYKDEYKKHDQKTRYKKEQEAQVKSFFFREIENRRESQILLVLAFNCFFREHCQLMECLEQFGLHSFPRAARNCQSKCDD